MRTRLHTVLLVTVLVSSMRAFLRTERVCTGKIRLHRPGIPTFRHYATPATICEDERFMKLALRHAQHAARDTEVPIGAVIVDSAGTVLAATRNQVEATQDATAHAEIAVMREAAQLQGSWRLTGCTLYSTLEPCPMCFAAMQSFRIKRLVYGARDTRLGACGSFVNLGEAKHPFHTIEVTGGLFGETSEGLLKRFFQSRRIEARGNGVLSGDNHPPLSHPVPNAHGAPIETASTS
jgi:tRNA(adenine34) deaminase